MKVYIVVESARYDYEKIHGAFETQEEAATYCEEFDKKTFHRNEWGKEFHGIGECYGAKWTIHDLTVGKPLALVGGLRDYEESGYYSKKD